LTIHVEPYQKGRREGAVSPKEEYKSWAKTGSIKLDLRHQKILKKRIL
jgi:hypothetical protein